MSITSRQIALLKVGMKQLGLSDADYRLCLVHIAGVTSATELDREGFEAILAFFEWKGFAPMTAHGPDFGQRPGMASFAQIELIWALWSEFTGGVYDGEAELNKWLLRTFKVSSLRFLTQDAARKAITALKAMKARAKAQRAA